MGVVIGTCHNTCTRAFVVFVCNLIYKRLIKYINYYDENIIFKQGIRIARKNSQNMKELPVW